MSVIVVGVDGSEGSEAALAFAAEEASLRGATLRIVSAYHVPSPVYAGGFAPAVALTSDLCELADEMTARAAARVKSLRPDVHVQCRTCEGQAAEELLREAQGADLLVVGSRGLGAFRSMVLGSVSQHVAHGAPCPVVIVPSSNQEKGA